MTWIERRIEEADKKVREIYNPATAFKDEALHKLLRQIEEDTAWLNDREKCWSCEGEGDRSCICECGNEHTIECHECGGDGYVIKEGVR